MDLENRKKAILRASAVGIATNIMLVIFKMGVGVITNSIAVILDAVNNLSDALSSLITIIGTKLANRKPDKKHPLGHGRIEFISGMIIAAIVTYAGLTALIESVKKILEPQKAEYTYISLIIIAVAVAVKIVLGNYMKSVGKKTDSSSLIASGTDAMFDAILSTAVLISAIIYMTTGLSLEAVVSVVISVFIIKAGIEMLRDTLDDILGKRVSSEVTAEIKKTICEEECVTGAYDLIMHSYGPNRYIASVHVEIPDTMTAQEIDLLERRISSRVYEKHGIVMAAIGIYSLNTTNDEIAEMRTKITRIVLEHEGVLQIHGFYADIENKVLNMDVIIDYGYKEREEMYEHIRNEIQENYPDFTLNMTMDIDI
ncbi:MAG: cation diffusion facilitator family transporter [Lachnospiraceae bacterium]|nr:cation diffusion facilitator family transporter [Lachnospiraceae bacterium]